MVFYPLLKPKLKNTAIYAAYPLLGISISHKWTAISFSVASYCRLKQCQFVLKVYIDAKVDVPSRTSIEVWCKPDLQMDNQVFFSWKGVTSSGVYFAPNWNHTTSCNKKLSPSQKNEESRKSELRGLYRLHLWTYHLIVKV